MEIQTMVYVLVSEGVGVDPVLVREGKPSILKPVPLAI